MITEDLIKHDDLEKCLKQFEKIDYESYGNNVMFLFYDYTFEKYEILFRNPSKINNNDIGSRDESPLKACHKTIDYINNNKHLFSYVNK